MKIIKKISEKIEKELDCSEDYIRLALKYKDDFPQIAQIFYNLSLNNLERLDKLHMQVVSIIKKYKQKQGEPPQAMKAIYNYLHERQIDKTLGIKKLQDMFR